MTENEGKRRQTLQGMNVKCRTVINGKDEIEKEWIRRLKKKVIVNR